MADGQTLQDVVDRLKAEGDLGRNSGSNSIKSVKETIIAQGNRNIEALTDVNFGIGTLMVGRLDSLLDFMTGSELSTLEKEKEQRAWQEKLLGAVKDNEKVKSKDDNSKPKSFDFGSFAGNLAAAILASLSGLVAGAMLGALKAQFETIKLAGRLGGWINGKISSMFSKLFKLVKLDGIASGTVTKMGTMFDDVIKSIKVLFTESKTALFVTKLGDAFGELFDDIIKGGKFIATSITDSMKFPWLTTKVDEIGTSVKAALNGFKNVFAPISGESKILKGVTSALESVKTFASNVGKWLDDIVKVAAPVSDIFKKLLVPLAVITTVWETVKGAMDGWEEEGFVGAIKGAITGLFTGLIGGLLDLIKDGTSWLLGLMGFEGLSEKLDSFSFSEEFGKLVDAVFAMPGKVVDYIVGLFNGETDLLGDMKGLANRVSDIGSKLNDYIKDMLASSLPPVDSWSAKVIPDVVYEYAGINPDTGEKIKADPVILPNTEGTIGQAASDVVNSESAELEAKRSQAAPVIIDASTSGGNTANVDSSSANINIGQAQFADDSVRFMTLPAWQ